MANFEELKGCVLENAAGKTNPGKWGVFCLDRVNCLIDTPTSTSPPYPRPADACSA